MHRGIKLSIGVGALLGGLLTYPAVGFGASTSGPFQVWVLINTNGNSTAKIVLTGSIGDYGSAQSVNSSSKPTNNGNYEKLTLKKGTILVNSTQFNQAQNNAQPQFNSSTCSVVFRATGPVQFVSGTGTYKGITGSATLTSQGGLVAPRNKNGSCNKNPNTKPLAGLLVATGSGNASY